MGKVKKKNKEKSVRKMSERRRESGLQRALGWVFTINNPTEGDIDHVTNLINLSENVKCGIAELEHTEEGEGTEHIQGYIFFERRQYRSTVRRWLGTNAHMEPAKASWQKNFEYCSKENKVFAIRGHTLDELKEKGNQKKVSMEKMIEDLHTLDYKEAIATYPVEWYKNRERMARVLNKVAMDQAEPWDGDLHLKNVWIFGAAGVGKSKWAASLADPSAIFRKNVNKWWDGYELFETRLVIIEDWPSKLERKDVLSQHVKVWGDRYPFIGECKGTHIQVDPGRFSIVITSNYPIDQCFENPEDIRAIRRRFQEIEMTSLNRTMIEAMELPLTILKDYIE